MDVNKMMADMWKQICCLQQIVAESGLNSPSWFTSGNFAIDEDEQFLGTINDDDLVFRTTNTERARLTKAGLFGIGTSVPDSILDVNGQITIRGGSPGVGKILRSDANGLGTWVTPTAVVISAANGTHIDVGTGSVYLGGSLLEATTITSGNPVFNISFTGINTTSDAPMFDAVSTGIGGTVFKGTNLTNHSTSRGVWGYTRYGDGIYGEADFTGNGVHGVASVSGHGVLAEAMSNNVALRANSINGVTAQLFGNGVGTNNIQPILWIQRGTTGTAANGIGSSIDFYIELDIGTTRPAVRLTSLWEDATNVTSKGLFQILIDNANVIQNVFEARATGAIKFPKYISNAFPGTPVKTLAVDVLGNIIMIDNAVSGTGTVTTADKGLTLSSPTTVQLGQVFNALGNPALINETRQIPLTNLGAILFNSSTDSQVSQTITSSTQSIQGNNTTSPSVQLSRVDLSRSFVVNVNTTANRFQIFSTGGLLIGTSTGFNIGNIVPTASVHIGISNGTAGTAPIKLIAGTLLGVLEDGTIEIDTNHLYVTLGGVRYQLDQQKGDEIEFTPGDVGFPIVGATTYVSSAIINRKVLVVRNQLVQRGTDPGDGSTYITKVFASNTITFSHALIATDYIQIIII